MSNLGLFDSGTGLLRYRSTFPVEIGDLHKRWKLVSKRLRNFQQCVVHPISSLSSGLYRHRAILSMRLADYIGLPCRIAHGYRYCTSDHRSSCLVKIKDDRQLSRLVQWPPLQLQLPNLLCLLSYKNVISDVLSIM